MMNPANYDITIHQGATFQLPLQYVDSNGTPVNMSGYTLKAQLRDRYNQEKLADFTASWVAQSSGIFRISLTDSVTSGITVQGQYDILVTEPSGDKYYILEGAAFLNEGVSYR